MVESERDVLSEPELALLCLDHLKESKCDGVDMDYITIACWALNRALAHPQSNNTSRISFPSLPEMEKEIHGAEEDEKKQEDEIDEQSGLRFYENAGLGERALRLPEITAAGLSALGARSRAAAEAEMVQSPLFDQFLAAVKAKGFFEEDQEPYEARYRKVVTKFRHKLISKGGTGEVTAEPLQRRRLEDLQNFSNLEVINPADLEEAEKLKNLGNMHMQKKEYEQAAECYTDALKLSPAGPHSHVYFSNRAAALVSMKEFESAILDSERSLALKPDYGKAHARLGLAHFLLGNYRQAMEAYTVALKYEPDNKSSKSYLEKSAKRLAEAGDRSHGGGSSNNAACFSVVSEWDNKKGSPANRHNVIEEREAEKYKVKGNSLMASRDYAEALEAYTKAIQLNPAGSQSHVYFSNRAAALCYLERYEDAAHDSMKSIALNPTYGKAHARLGLSRFFLQDYEAAVAAYTKALEYDPDNAASKSYLAKAQAKLDEQQRR